MHQCCGSPLEPSVATRRVANVHWGGADLAAILLDELEIDPRARFLWSYGLDGGDFAGTSCDWFVKDLPLARLAAGDVLLAYELNGAPLPAEHGFPLRLVVPGYYGTNSVKWLWRLQLAERPGRRAVHDRCSTTTAAPRRTLRRACRRGDRSGRQHRKSIIVAPAPETTSPRASPPRSGAGPGRSAASPPPKSASTPAQALGGRRSSSGAAGPGSASRCRGGRPPRRGAAQRPRHRGRRRRTAARGGAQLDLHGADHRAVTRSAPGLLLRAPRRRACRRQGLSLSGLAAAAAIITHGPSNRPSFSNAARAVPTSAHAMAFPASSEVAQHLVQGAEGTPLEPQTFGGIVERSAAPGPSASRRSTAGRARSNRLSISPGSPRLNGPGWPQAAAAECRVPADDVPTGSEKKRHSPAVA